MDWVENHKEGSSQRLKSEEAIERNQVKKAIAADIWYLLQNFEGQYGFSARRKRSTTLAVEHAAASVRIDKTCHATLRIHQILVAIGCSTELWMNQNGAYPISNNNYK